VGVLESHGEWAAYCLDQAIFWAGKFIESELDKVKEGKGKNAARARAVKQERLLQKLLGQDASAGKRFADPADLLKKKSE
jgi:hypothetical protein